MPPEVRPAAATAHEGDAVGHEIPRRAQRRVPARTRDVPIAARVRQGTPVGRRGQLLVLVLVLVRLVPLLRIVAMLVARHATLVGGEVCSCPLGGSAGKFLLMMMVMMMVWLEVGGAAPAGFHLDGLFLEPFASSGLLVVEELAG